MSKEKILEEFDKISPEFGKWRMDRNMAIAFLSQAIDQTKKETREETINILPKIKGQDELIRDLCSVEFRSKSKTKELIASYTKQVREETIKEIEESLPPIIGFEGDDEFLNGYDSVLKKVLSILNKLKN